MKAHSWRFDPCFILIVNAYVILDVNVLFDVGLIEDEGDASKTIHVYVNIRLFIVDDVLKLADDDGETIRNAEVDDDQKVFVTKSRP